MSASHENHLASLFTPDSEGQLGTESLRNMEEMSAASQKAHTSAVPPKPSAPRWSRRTSTGEQFGSMAIEQLDGSADLGAARDALEEHRWQEAFDLLSRRIGRGRSTPRSRGPCRGGVVQGPARPGVEAKERAFKAHLDRGRGPAAALAFDLAREYACKLKVSIASAWAARGERLLKGKPEGFAHGYLTLSESFAAEHAATSTRRSGSPGGPWSWARVTATATCRPGDCSSRVGS